MPKQASLFSFFGAAKKKTSTPASKPVSKPSQSTASTSTTSSSTTASKPQASSSPPPSTSPQQAQPVKINDAISIYYKQDSKWYGCKVTSFSGSGVVVTYPDGQSEKVNLSTTKWKFSNAMDEEEEEEEEAEFDDEASEDSFAPKPDDDESEEEDWLADSDEEEDDMEVEEEDEEDLAESPKKKRRLSKKSASKSASKSKKHPPQSKVSFSPDYDGPARSSTSNSNQLAKFTLTMESSNAVTPSKATAPASSRSSPPVSSVSSKDEIPMFVEGEVNAKGSHMHNHLRFLWPENLTDANGVKYGHPDYNPRTLRFGPAEMKELARVMPGKVTDAKRQWWEIKSQYFDTVLLFKTGKFYEMFHMDSDIGVEVLGFSHMKGAEGHAGSPEAAYGTVCKKLVDAGYKVARVEQTETPAQLAIRKKKAPKGKKPGVVNREVCAVTTIGTRTFCFLDDDKIFEKKSAASGVPGPLLVIKEILLSPPPTQSSDSAEDSGPPPAACEYGISVIDAVNGSVTLGQFADDKLRSRLKTLLATTMPSEAVIHTKSSADLLTMIKNTCGAVSVEFVNSKETLPSSTAILEKDQTTMQRKGWKDGFDPWNRDDCVSEMKRKKYFPSSSKEAEAEETMARWPDVLKACVDGGADLAVGALGAGIFYLQRALVDYEIMSMAEVRAYVPPTTTGADIESTSNKDGNEIVGNLSKQREVREDGVDNASGEHVEHMSIDGITLENLELLVNLTDGKAKGSLWSKINRSRTPHGSRLLKGWLLRPLFKKHDIERRANAVAELACGAAALTMTEARPLLNRVGDLERLLSRVHSMGSVEPGHPANRQVLYEGKTHTIRKVKDFSNLLSGLEMCNKIGTVFIDTDVSSPLLKKIVKRADQGGAFPDMNEKLEWFANNFDKEKAKAGLFTPVPGMDDEYDAAVAEIEECKTQLMGLKDQYCDELKGARGVFKYINIKPDSKDKYLIELPVSVKVGSNFVVKGKRGSGAKQVNKYYTRDVEDIVKVLNEAYDKEAEGRARGLAAIFRKFDSYRTLWSTAVQVTAMLDALSSLAEVSGQPGWSRPEILDAKDDNTGSIVVNGGVHPCVDTTHSGDDFVPNDLAIGGVKPRVLLLSGPNMGGKSTLLRQTCLISILAQMGCFVPAISAKVCPVDRIFTRLGASDKLLAGQSTFFVELSETAAALRGATSRSLVIMDELGRGTSTFDGTAIAHAVVKSLVEDCKCLTMFATHYHSLLADWEGEEQVRLGHMKCLVEDESNITFLYQLGDGPCPKSFGINVARMAGLSEDILRIAAERSAAFSKEMASGEENEEEGRERMDLVRKMKEAVGEGDHEALEGLVAGL
mmetsp:Transcript_3918/g.7901  ORF Transcript_3918/g.7901 Transcript_3918/m.7901 type:complete len:1338 (-) Transcript_3918:11-4024(-)